MEMVLEMRDRLSITDDLERFIEEHHLRCSVQVMLMDDCPSCEYDGEYKDGAFHGTGVLKFNDGGVYSGHFQNGHFNGQGTLTFSSENKYYQQYEGQWKDGGLHGNGKMIYKSGKTYDGQWSRGKKHGLGKLFHRDRVAPALRNWEYDGFFSNDLYHGAGHLRHSNGDIYSGAFIRGKKSGIGRLFRAADGTTYEGVWLNNKEHGQGKFTTHRRGRIVYQGQFERGKLHGIATMTYPGHLHNWPSDFIYKGEWKDGHQHGKGEIKFIGGDCFIGEFKHGKICGQGEFTYTEPNKVYTGDQFTGYIEADFITQKFELVDFKGNGVMKSVNGTKYAGDFLGGKYHGRGGFHGLNGEMYYGTFKNGKLNGEGVRSFPDGTRYVGHFTNNRKDGYGVCTYADNSPFLRYEGHWKRNLWHGHGTIEYKNGQQHPKYEGAFIDGYRHGEGVLHRLSGDQVIMFYNYGIVDEKHSNNLNALNDLPDKYLNEEQRDSIICPITHSLYRQPVKATDGRTYEKTAIEKAMRVKGLISPWTREVLTPELVPDLKKMREIENLFEALAESKRTEKKVSQEPALESEETMYDRIRKRRRR